MDGVEGVTGGSEASSKAGSLLGLSFMRERIDRKFAHRGQEIIWSDRADRKEAVNNMFFKSAAGEAGSYI